MYVCMYVCIKRVRWCTCGLWRTLGKLIGLLFCLPSSLLLFVENSKNTRNELARPVMGTIFLVTVVLNPYTTTATIIIHSVALGNVY